MRAPALDIQGLAAEARARGLEILGTGEYKANRELLVIWLHGNAGQWVDGLARRIVAGIPGVVNVVDSVQTPTILFVRIELIESASTEKRRST
jgi:hypothetical protein